MAVMEYRTRDGLADFGFSIEFQSDRGWRVYIIFDPFNYGDERTVDLPYQSIDAEGRRYVNWPPVLDSLGDAKTVAGIWAELAQHYPVHHKGTRIVCQANTASPPQPETEKSYGNSPPTQSQCHVQSSRMQRGTYGVKVGVHFGAQPVRLDPDDTTDAVS
jgi:hypothetical protein